MPTSAIRNIYLYIYHTQKFRSLSLNFINFISCFPEQPTHLQKALASFAIMTASINDLLHNLNKPRNIYLCVKFLKQVSFLDMLMEMGTTYFLEKCITDFFDKKFKNTKFHIFFFIKFIYYTYLIFLFIQWRLLVATKILEQ